jgi:hypothetical protein
MIAHLLWLQPRALVRSSVVSSIGWLTEEIVLTIPPPPLSPSLICTPSYPGRALLGDHGWQLGEHNIWGKHTNFELGTRVPLMISVPGLTMGGVSGHLVESVDLYPTIAAVAGQTPTH